MSMWIYSFDMCYLFGVKYSLFGLLRVFMKQILY